MRGVNPVWRCGKAQRTVGVKLAHDEAHVCPHSWLTTSVCYNDMLWAHVPPATLEGIVPCAPSFN